MTENNYVLITPARNEERFIAKTLESVVAQVLPPKKWVIVSDGSTDRTDEIVAQVEKQHGFIKLIRLETAHQRNFAAKARAIKTAYRTLADLDFDFIGNLDADISFEPDYFARIFREFERDPKLGVAGGDPFDVIDGKIVQVVHVRNHVRGAVQMFRRHCYEEIGGYPLLRHGGIDTAAEIMVRMNGWQTQSFAGIPLYHHRLAGTAKSDIWRARLKEGKRDYCLGWHPLFMVAKSLARLSEKPYVLGTLIRLAAYLHTWLQREERQLSDEFISFVHKEQMDRLRVLLKLTK